MEPTETAPHIVRFGIFEADLGKDELRKRGHKVPLQDQPWQVLALLLRRAGETVTRDELQVALWPGETLVEFEAGINTAIRKVRLALGDTAESPRYIETLPRKGYRFIAPVAFETPDPAPHPIAPQERASRSVVSPRRRKRKIWPWTTAPGLLLILVLITGLWPPHLPKTRVTTLTTDPRQKGARIMVHGGRVYYTLGATPPFYEAGLWSVPTSGGESRHESSPCPEGMGVLIHNVSFARQRVLYSCHAESDYYNLGLADLDWGNLKPLGRYDLSNVLGLSISPDLSTLYLTRAEGIFVKPTGGGPERLLARYGAVGNLFDIGLVVPHPSGTRLTVFGQVNGLFDIWEVKADGTGLHRAHPEFGWCGIYPHWSPDGRRLYFAANANMGDPYLLEEPGLLGWMRQPMPVRLTWGTAEPEYPYEDPDDPFTIYAVGKTYQVSSMKLNREANAWESFLGGMPADCVSFSPDGEWVAYVNRWDATLWKCRRDGSDKVVLADGLATYTPRWSPDGKRIAFSGKKFSVYDNRDHWHIFTIPANGGNPEPVPGVTGLAFNATWSPDGNKLAFAPYAGEGKETDRHASIVDLRTGAVEALPGSNGKWSLRWSPDGKSVAGLSEGVPGIFLYSFATKKWTVLSAINVGFPQWSSDSRYIYCSTVWSKTMTLYRIDVMKHRVKQVRSITDFDLTGLMGVGASWTPEGEPIVLKDLTTTQIYRVERGH